MIQGGHNMSGLLAAIQQNIFSVFNRMGTENSTLAEAALRRVVGRHIPVQGRFKIFIPYPAEELSCSLLEMNPMLELVCLSSQKQLERMEEGRQRICFSDGDLRSFRARADFDMVLFSLQGVEGSADRLSEDLCHCRMLLKPGGQLFLHVRNYKAKSFLEPLRVEREGVHQEYWQGQD